MDGEKNGQRILKDPDKVCLNELRNMQLICFLNEK